MTTPAATPDEIIARLEAVADEFATFVESTGAEHFGTSSNGAWSVAEITGHAAEFPATFAAHALRLANAPGSSVGRFEDDGERLAAVARLAGRGPAEAAAFLRAGAAVATATLRGIPAHAWDVEGVRIINGEPMTVRALIELLVIGHLRGHLKGAREALARALG